ncbi:MAG: LPP20 family lipoprotein [Elusimicrobiota bacterium]
MKSLSVLGLAVLFVLSGCASAPKKPDWIMKGSGAFKSDKKVLHGVGIAENITSEALRRQTADNRAIAEVSKQLSVMSTSMMRDYMASTSVTEQEKASGEQYVENTVKTFASNTVSGIKIVDRWDDGKKTYSLAELNVDDLKALSEKVNELSAQVKEYIIENAEMAFDKLEAEQAKSAK